jgi:MYXO-CTERM domain-containing protein
VAALLRRRVAPLLVLAVVLAVLPATALGNGRAVLADYRDNGQIDRCYTLAEYQQALKLVRPDQAQYGALVDVILNAQVTNLKVPGQPCRPKVTTTTAADSSDDDGGSSTFLWVGVILGVGVVAIGAGALVRRRRGGGGGGDGGGDAGASPAGGDGGTEG